MIPLIHYLVLVKRCLLMSYRRYSHCLTPSPLLSQLVRGGGTNNQQILHSMPLFCFNAAFSEKIFAFEAEAQTR